MVRGVGILAISCLLVIVAGCAATNHGDCRRPPSDRPSIAANSPPPSVSPDNDATDPTDLRLAATEATSDQVSTSRSPGWRPTSDVVGAHPISLQQEPETPPEPLPQLVLPIEDECSRAAQRSRGDSRRAAKSRLG